MITNYERLVERVDPGTARMLRITEEELRRDGHIALADGYGKRAVPLEEHIGHLRDIHNRMNFGSSFGEVEHGRIMACWLIENGWKPPKSIIVYTGETGESSEADTSP